MQIRALIILITIGLLGGIGWWLFSLGKDTGYAACEAKHLAAAQAKQVEIDAQSSAESTHAIRFAEEISERRLRSQEIEDEIRADPSSCRTIDPDSLRRLERRWGEPEGK